MSTFSISVASAAAASISSGIMLLLTFNSCYFNTNMRVHMLVNTAHVHRPCMRVCCMIFFFYLKSNLPR
jgi:hypothetical protein